MGQNRTGPNHNVGQIDVPTINKINLIKKSNFGFKYNIFLFPQVDIQLGVELNRFLVLL